MVAKSPLTFRPSASEKDHVEKLRREYALSSMSEVIRLLIRDSVNRDLGDIAKSNEREPTLNVNEIHLAIQASIEAGINDLIIPILARQIEMIEERLTHNLKFQRYFVSLVLDSRSELYEADKSKREELLGRLMKQAINDVKREMNHDMHTQ